ncbi:transposase, partial [Elizabethkingia argentiflava]|nr:transposase [Elizabethkingia argenteiflava]
SYGDSLRNKIAAKISVSDYYIVDSMPLEICKLIRSCRSTVCRKNYFTSPDKGFCAWQNSVYYGYKLHAVFTTDGIFIDFDVTQASVHDIHY